VITADWDGDTDDTDTGSEEPSITVLTEFPEGTVTSARVDIEYIATASRGATIDEIYYEVNGENTEFLYIPGHETKGELGTGYVLLRPEENDIVFTIEDTNGKTAQFTVDQHPYYDVGYTPEIDYSKMQPSKQGKDVQYLPDMIMLMTEADVLREEVLEMIQSVDGTIVGEIHGIHEYYIQVSGDTEDKLKAMCTQLEATYGNKIANVGLYYIGGAVSHSTDDPWWDEQPISDESPIFDEQMQHLGKDEYKEWALPYRQWGLDAINAPTAWETFSEYIKSNPQNGTDEIKIGIIDDGILALHEDLRIPSSNVYNTSGSGSISNQNHGTHVMGILA
jgi:subtilisin family serine protease